MNDYISRQMAVDVIEDYPHGDVWNVESMEEMVDKIKALPSVQPKRKTGQWIPYEYGDERWHQCTACGVADKYIDYVKGYDGKAGKLVSVRNYCPNCGARMERDDSD